MLALRKIVKVDDTTIGFPVYLRRLTVGEAEIYHAAVNEDSKKVHLLMRLLLSFCLCDEKGVRLFTDPDELRDIDAAAVEVLALKAWEINGFTKEARVALEKKVQAAPAGSPAS